MRTIAFQINYKRRIEQRITFVFSIVDPNMNRSILITLLLTIFHVVPATTEPFIVAGNHLCPLLISVGFPVLPVTMLQMFPGHESR
jgi:hypothetical protein